MAQNWPYPTVQGLIFVPVGFLSFMLISIISPIYSERNSGLLKMLQTQSMYESSYLLGTSIYSFIVQFVYSLVLLTLLFASPIFRTASTPDCTSDDSSGDGYYNYYGYNGCGLPKFGDKPVVRPNDRKIVLPPTGIENEDTVYAHFAPGGYGMMLGALS